MKLCEYGCGKEAKYLPSKGKLKWSCESHPSKCSKIKQKNSKAHINKNHSYETILKMSESKKGHKHSFETIEKIRKSNNRKKRNKETREKISKSTKGRIPWNKGRNDLPKGWKHSDETKLKIGLSNKGNKISEETRLKLSESSKLTIKKIHKKYKLFSKIEELRYNPLNPKEIQARCKNHNCPNSKEKNGWFTPTHIEISERIRQIEADYGTGGSYLYCSDKCKDECPLYGKKVTQLIKEDEIRARIIKEEYYTLEEYNIWRQEVLKRAENICEYCGEIAEHCHHIKPQKLEPFFSLDPDYGIACCKDCHYKYGHQDECSTGQLAIKVCN